MIKADGVEVLMREQELRRERQQADQIQWRQILLHQLQKAVEKNDEPVQENFLNEAKLIRAEILADTS